MWLLESARSPRAGVFVSMWPSTPVILSFITWCPQGGFKTSWICEKSPEIPPRYLIKAHRVCLIAELGERKMRSTVKWEFVAVKQQ